MSLSSLHLTLPARNYNGVAALPFPNKAALQVAKCGRNHKSSNLKLSSQSILATKTDRCTISAKVTVDVQKFRGKAVVVKWGGEALKSETLRASVAKDVACLSRSGLHIALVYGVGPEIGQWLTELNIDPNFLDGLRTDALTMDDVSTVLFGKVNKDLVHLINEAGASAVGLSDVDGQLLTARTTPDDSTHGFVGEIESVNPMTPRLFIDSGHIPVIASVASDAEGQYYIIDADTLACKLAVALGAEKLVLLSDTVGILEDNDDPNSLVKEINVEGAKKMMRDRKIGGEMSRKADCCLRCLDQGVPTASIIDARVEHSLLHEFLPDKRTGTMITK